MAVIKGLVALVIAMLIAMAFIGTVMFFGCPIVSLAYLSDGLKGVYERAKDKSIGKTNKINLFELLIFDTISILAGGICYVATGYLWQLYVFVAVL